MRNRLSTGWERFLLFGMVAGAIVSAVITLIVVLWEWLENPGGIFRNDQGTNWQFMFDTTISWFVPVFFCTAIVALIARLAWSAIRHQRNDN